MSEAKFIPLSDYREYSIEDMRRRAEDFNTRMQRRRSVRQFSNRPVPREVIEQCLRAAGSAPSAANRQPWQFVVVESGGVKRRILEASEAQEREFYGRRASQKWLDALVPLGTDEHKPFLKNAPCLIAIFIQRHGLSQDGRKIEHYYPTISVGIATGILLTAIHHAGLAALTYTPPQMRFLKEILERPDNERPYMVLVVGYPADDARVPHIRRKTLEEIAEFV